MAAAEIMVVQVQLVLVEALGIHVEELTADVEHSSVRCSSGFRRACKRKPNRPGRSLPQKVSGGGGSSWSCGSRLQWGPLKAIAASVLPHTCWGKAADSAMQLKRGPTWPATNNARQEGPRKSCHCILEDVTCFQVLWRLVAQRVHLECQRALGVWINVGMSLGLWGGTSVFLY